MSVLVRTIALLSVFSLSFSGIAAAKKPLFSTQTQIIPYNRYQSKLARDCRMFPKTFNWFEKFWLRNRELQIPAEVYHHSPWLFEIALVKSLSHVGEEGALLSVENLPEFMARGTTEFELNQINGKINSVAREACLKIAFRELIEKCHLEFDESFEKAFSDISLSACSEEEFVSRLVGLAHLKTYIKSKKSINLEISKAFLESRRDNIDLFKQQRAFLCNYIQAHLERAALLTGGAYVKRCEENFNVESIIKISKRIRFLVGHYSQTYHRQFKVFIKQKRFDIFYAKPLESIKFDAKKFPFVSDFERPKLAEVSKSLNSLVLWDCAFLFVKNRLLGELEDRSKTTGLVRYIKARLSEFSSEDLLQSNLIKINQQFSKVIKTIIADQRFWDEFELEKETIQSLVGKNIFHEKDCMSRFNERKKYYISQMKEFLIFDELKKDSGLIFPEATAMIAEPFKHLFSQYFTRLERKLADRKPMVLVIPKMRSSTR